MQLGQCLSQNPPYLFAQIDLKKEEVLARGIDISGMGAGDPCKPTLEAVQKVMMEVVKNPSTHK